MYDVLCPLAGGRFKPSFGLSGDVLRPSAITNQHTGNQEGRGVAKSSRVVVPPARFDRVFEPPVRKNQFSVLSAQFSVLEFLLRPCKRSRVGGWRAFRVLGEGWGS
jgi:hypothetical protein